MPGDLRAWDGLLTRERLRIGVEAETRLRDVQAVLRRIEAKRRDDGVDRVILVLADTRTNREAVRAAAGILAAAFPIEGRDAWAALAAGLDPGGDALLFA